MKGYASEIKRAMLHLADHEDTLFLGQSVAYPGNVIYKNLADIPDDKKLELPVFEATQMGMSIGLALEGVIPISIYPRFNFLLLALDQLENHLDKLPTFSQGGYNPKVIIKTMVGSRNPLHPGAQHCSNYTYEFKHMLNNIHVVDLRDPDIIFSAYDKALNDNRPTLLIEHGDLYSE